MYNDKERSGSVVVSSPEPDVQFLKNENPPKVLYEGRKFEQKTLRVILPYCWYESIYLKKGSFYRWPEYPGPWYMALADIEIDVENSGTMLETLEFEDDSVKWELRVFY